MPHLAPSPWAATAGVARQASSTFSFLSQAAHRLETVEVVAEALPVHLEHVPRPAESDPLQGRRDEKKEKATGRNLLSVNLSA
eukprot:761841-Hanusia_phi.AAC.8